MTRLKKTIILMRHADTLPASLKDIDANRELSPKGINQAGDAAIFLAKFNVDKLLVSPTVRTQQTLHIIQQQISLENVEIVPEIYKETDDKIVEIILTQPDEINCLMIIGHNPSICALAFNLTKPTDKGYEYLMSTLMPPATIVVIDIFDIDSWSELSSKHLGNINDIFIVP